MGIKLKDVVYGGYGLGYATDIDNKDTEKDEINIIDNDWVKNRFMVPSKDLEDIDKINRYFTNSRWKFVNSSLGGHIAINPRPQFTRYADIRHGSRLDSIEDQGVTINQTSLIQGMGRYYSESIDDNATMIYMSFGVPKFNSLLDFFTRAVDPVDSFVARTGRLPNSYNVGDTIGTVGRFIFMPLLSTVIFLGKQFFSLRSNTHSFNYYYLEPAPHLYWGTVNLLVNQMANEIGFLVPGLSEASDGEAPRMGGVANYDKEDVEYLNRIIPGLINPKNNYIDVYRLATRAQAVYNRIMIAESERDRQYNGDPSDFEGFVKKHDSTKPYVKNALMNSLNKWTSLSFVTGHIHETYDSFIQFMSSTLFSPIPEKSDENDLPTSTNIDPSKMEYGRDASGAVKYELSDKEKKYETNFLDTFDATVRDGAEYVAFMVDYQGSVSESFSNSIGSLEIESGIKSTAQAVHNAKFNFAGGNIIDETITNLTNMAVDVIKGVLDGATAGLSTVISNILGGGYVDFPKKWEDSDVSFPSITYKTRLVAPYGDPISQLQNIYIPLACLMAGALPLSVGRTSYSSPYLCSVFNRGVQKIDLGMITSLSIDRGVSNLPFSKTKRALALDVSWTVTDFSSLAAAPVSSSMLTNAFRVSLDDDLPINKYLSVVAGASLYRNKYFLPKVKLMLSRYVNRKETFFNGDMWMMRAGEMMVGPLSIPSNSLGFNTQDNKY